MRLKKGRQTVVLKTAAPLPKVLIQKAVRMREPTGARVKPKAMPLLRSLPTRHPSPQLLSVFVDPRAVPALMLRVAFARSLPLAQPSKPSAKSSAISEPVLLPRG